MRIKNTKTKKKETETISGFAQNTKRIELKNFSIIAQIVLSSTNVYDTFEIFT